MLVFVIDDEAIALEELAFAVRKALPDAEIRQFRKAEAALRSIRENSDRPDVVFSDIHMPGTDGLELAVSVKMLCPDTGIIFVTGYSDYALEAFQVHADGYLLKPVLPEQITEEIAHLRIIPQKADEKLCVWCFGHFEIFWNGKPLSFKRRKSKELFAYLIDREGATCTAEEIAAILWEDESNLRNAKHNLRNLVSDLHTVLEEIGMADVLIRGSGTIAVDRTKVDCDYFRLLDGDATAVNAYRGEFMKQYHWAQMTEAKLHFNR